MPNEPPVAIYHLHVKNISRSDGRSAVAAAAYRAGETLPNFAEEKDSAFAGKRDVVFTAILLPAGAPRWMADRASLWNAAEAAEKRKDARLAKEIEFALPVELPRAMWPDVAKAMAEAYVAQGHVVDIAVHDDGTLRNPHVHLMLTTRSLGPEGFGKKLRDADGVAFVTQAREGWAAIANAALGKAGANVQIDARSHALRGLDQKPTKHRGPDPAERRARRWGKTMLDHDLLEARRDLLAEARMPDRFPLLAARADWPPERREAVPGLTPGEAAEWKTFWHEVDKRMWGPELYPPRNDNDQVQFESRDPVQVGEVARKLTDEVMRNAALREATIEDAFPVWEELHAAMVERMRADGHSTDDPVYDWRRIEASMRDFHAKLTDLRLQEAERRTHEPVPDPFGRPISPLEREAAEEGMMIEAEQQPSSVAPTPRPEHQAVESRDAARAAVERQNNIEMSDREAADYRLAPHESRLDWLEAAPGQSAREPEREDRLDWLRTPRREPTRDDGPEREQER